MRSIGSNSYQGIWRNHICQQKKTVIEELSEKVNLKPDNIVAVGRSTSEVLGVKIGTNFNPETVREIFEALHVYAIAQEVFLTVQCCEYLNRAVIVEHAAVPSAEIVNVIHSLRQVVHTGNTGVYRFCRSGCR